MGVLRCTGRTHQVNSLESVHHVGSRNGAMEQGGRRQPVYFNISLSGMKT